MCVLSRANANKQLSADVSLTHQHGSISEKTFTLCPVIIQVASATDSMYIYVYIYSCMMNVILTRPRPKKKGNLIQLLS